MTTNDPAVKASIKIAEWFGMCGPNDVGVIASIIRQEYAELQRVVDALPRTADGVPVVRGTELWAWLPGYDVPQSLTGLASQPSYIYLESSRLVVDFDKCYSTQAAAISAAEGSKDEC